jgi:protein TonB
MMLLIDRLNQERHKVSSLGALGLVLVVFSLAQTLKEPAQIVAQEAMELTIAIIEPLLQAPPPPLPQPPKPEIKPKTVPTVTQAQAPAPTEVRKEAATPEAPRAMATPPATPTLVPAANPAPVVNETPKPQPPVTANLESNYIASMRATLNANKRYPTGREASLQRPAGKVKVWFVLMRNGALQEAGIEESSNSIILDNAALATVRRTSYSPWPEGTWSSEAQHKFTVTLDFVPLN